MNLEHAGYDAITLIRMDYWQEDISEIRPRPRL